MFKKILVLSTLFIISFVNVVQSASANDNLEMITTMGVEDPGGVASVPVTLGTGPIWADSQWIKIIDGTANLYVTAKGGPVAADIYYVYAGGPDRLYKSYTVQAGKTMNITINNFDQATYKLRLRKPESIVGVSGYGHLAD